MVEYPLSIEEEEEISEQVKNLSDRGKWFRIEQVRFIVSYVRCSHPRRNLFYPHHLKHHPLLLRYSEE